MLERITRNLRDQHQCDSYKLLEFAERVHNIFSDITVHIQDLEHPGSLVASFTQEIGLLATVLSSIRNIIRDMQSPLIAMQARPRGFCKQWLSLSCALEKCECELRDCEVTLRLHTRRQYTAIFTTLIRHQKIDDLSDTRMRRQRIGITNVITRLLQEFRAAKSTSLDRNVAISEAPEEMEWEYWIAKILRCRRGLQASLDDIIE